MKQLDDMMYLEAMQCGVPTIVSNKTSLPEIAGDAALIADAYEVDDIADKLQQVLKDTELRQKLKSRGIHRAAEFSWENTARKTLEAYTKILD